MVVVGENNREYITDDYCCKTWDVDLRPEKEKVALYCDRRSEEDGGGGGGS